MGSVGISVKVWRLGWDNELRQFVTSDSSVFVFQDRSNEELHYVQVLCLSLNQTHFLYSFPQQKEKNKTNYLEFCLVSMFIIQNGQGGGLAGVNGQFSDLSFRHATTQTYAYFEVFSFFRKKIVKKKNPTPVKSLFENTIGNPLFHFSKHWPSGPMLSISRFVRLYVCPSVRLSVCPSVHF